MKAFLSPHNSPRSPRRVPLLFLLCAVLTIMLLSAGNRALADGAPPEFSYVYAPVLGTGYYKASGDNIAVLRIPLTYELTDDLSDPVRTRARLTATAGVSNFDLQTLRDRSLPKGVRTYSVMPGVGWQIDMGNDWQLNPYFEIGLARDIAQKQMATLADAGVRSIKRWDAGNGILSLGNGAVFAGQEIHGSPNRQGFVLFENGLDYEVPTGWHLGQHSLTASGFVLWRHFANNLAFAGVDGERISLQDLFYVGVTFGFAKPVHWHHIPLQRVGVSLVRGDNLKAISFNLGFPF